MKLIEFITHKWLLSEWKEQKKQDNKESCKKYYKNNKFR